LKLITRFTRGVKEHPLFYNALYLSSTTIKQFPII